jgi:hypothetical protein
VCFFNVDEVKRIKGKSPLKVKDDSPEVIPYETMKNLLKNMMKNASVKEFVKEEFEEKPNKKGKKKEKVLSEDEKQHLDYLKKNPILHARSAPTALHTAIHGIKHVDIEKFLEEIGFSSFCKFDISRIPSRLGRYVVEYRKASPYVLLKLWLLLFWILVLYIHFTHNFEYRTVYY